MTLTLPSPAAPARRPAAPAPPPIIAGRYDGPVDLSEQMLLARALAGAYGTVPTLYRNNPANVLVAIYSARTLDVGVITAMQQLYFDNGRQGMAGSLMQGLILRARHRVEVVHSDAKRAEMILHRCDHPVPSEPTRWTIAEAVAAGLTGRETWRSYPTDMLFWRCLSRLARRFASDCVHGFGYVPDELVGPSVDDLPSDAAEQVVDPDVQALLADLDSLDSDALHQLWEDARASGLAGRYAGTVDGVELTVEQLLAVFMERAVLTAAETAHTAATDTEAQPTASTSTLPAGTGVLDCGCVAKVVLSTGWHRMGCPEQGDVFAEDLLPTVGG